MVVDRDLMYQVEIRVEQLEDPLFNLIGWYTQQKAKMPWKPTVNGAASGSSHACWQSHVVVKCPLNDNCSEDLHRKDEGQEDIYQDLPGIIALYEDSDEDDDYQQEELLAFLWEDQHLQFDEAYLREVEEYRVDIEAPHRSDYSMILWLNDVLTTNQPFPGDVLPVDPSYVEGEFCFLIERISHGLLSIYD